MLTIDIETLEPGVHALTFVPVAEALELDPGLFRDVGVDVRLDVSERRVLVSLAVRACVTLECDRTLQAFDQEIEGAYRMLYASPGFADEACNEIRTLDPGNREIDITDIARDTILLAVPTRRVAPGAEDIELPTMFGAPQRCERHAGVDPRWEALRVLIPEEKQGSQD